MLGRRECARVLLEHGAPCNTKSKLGWQVRFFLSFFLFLLSFFFFFSFSFLSHSFFFSYRQSMKRGATVTVSSSSLWCSIGGRKQRPTSRSALQGPLKRSRNSMISTWRCVGISAPGVSLPASLCLPFETQHFISSFVHFYYHFFFHSFLSFFLILQFPSSQDSAPLTCTKSGKRAPASALTQP